MELEQGNESGVSTEGTSGPETSSPVESQNEGAQQEAVATPDQNVPFHEHPRFKELVEQKNKYANQYTQLEDNYKKLEAQIKQLQTPVKTEVSSRDKILERLQSIDPEFANFQKELVDKFSMADQLKQELEHLKTARQQEVEQRQAQEANQTFDKLLSEHKVSKNMEMFYRQAIANAAMAKGSKVSDLPVLFKEAHDQLSKSFEDIRRQDREAYATSKKSDKAPATQSGGTPASGKQTSGENKDSVKAAIAQALRNGASI